MENPDFRAPTMENPVVSVKSLAIPRATRLSTGGFTLMEILVVLAVIAILIALTVPTLSSLSGSTSLATGTRQVSNYLTLARTEAIKRHTVTRFVVVTGASETEDVSYRRYGIWEWNPEYEDGEDPRRWRPLSSWQDLPLDAVFEPDPPTYIRDSIYAEKDGASIRGDFFFQDEANVFEEMTGGEEFKMQYIEFTPSGAARQRGGTERNIMVVLTAGIIAPGESDEGEPTIVYKNAEEGSPNNWAQMNIDTLTGSVKIYRP